LVLLPGKRGLTMVVTTELGAVPLMVPVDEDTLVKLVQELREALRTRGDYQTAAKALHQYLIAPAEQQLGQQAGIQQWAILPYGALRNLPFATLMDTTGQHLIERYALVTLTADGEGGFSGLDTAPKTEWRSAGFGASIADSAFNNVALPGVRTELCGIVSDPSEAAECQAQTSGVIPGRRYLNAHFTSAKLNLLIGPPTSTQAPSLLHIATHFSIDKSMLLLGDGGTLTLKTIGQWKPRLGHYDLVALSACDSGKTEAGVESLGGLFRKLGAKSVLATLWPLADVGAGPLMVEFYRQRGAQRVMAKSEALRRAQLAMLRGELKNPDNPATDLRHPYYWAGYVLMGNWL
jgi:CHAT domain-containing protein